MEAVPADIRVVRLVLGDDLAQVRANSSQAFPPGPIPDSHPLAVTEPVILEYKYPGHSFRLPPGRYLWIDTYAQHVCLIRCSPHLSYLDREAAFALVKELMALFEERGWTRRSGGLPPIEVVRAELNNPRTDSEYVTDVGRWATGDDRLGLRLSRTMTVVRTPTGAGPTLEQFLVTVSVENEKVYSTYDAIAKQRKAAGRPKT